ncbi:hypothetical protein IMY97_08335 [Pectobacterium versatile]|uniref:hypothetical protein n=1 Tax=Pectobacterium versatile TaxID=2488639 RepID=UPI001FA6F4D0|nr:hypothetical protein [Pectobacterium versatile]UNE80105.1 hypothetical protein IMY97_08335 [Pectobacterium versatile]
MQPSVRGIKQTHQQTQILKICRARTRAPKSRCLPKKKRAAAENDTPPPEQIKAQQKAAAEYSLATTGIPLYNGKLISVIKYPDGNSEMFDAFTGQRITQEDLAFISALHGSDGEQVLHFESKTSYSNLSAAEVYQQIQEMLHGSGDQEELA